MRFLTWKLAVVLVVSVFGSAVIAGLGGRLTYNDSESVPMGFYTIVHEPIRTGDYVVFMPPEGGVFELGRERGYFRKRLLKRVAAVGGDEVEISAAGVFINDQLWPCSMPRSADAMGRALPTRRVQKKLSKREMILMSDCDDYGFDSRYFGVVESVGVEGVAKPLLTWLL